MEKIDREQSVNSAGQIVVQTKETPMQEPHLVWVFPAHIMDRLDNATWLRTTDELRKLGWKVTLISMGPAGAQSVNGVETLCLPRPDVYLMGNALFHINVLRFIVKHLHTIDIVLFNQDSGVWFFPLRLLRSFKGQSRPKIVMDTRDLSDVRPGDWKTTARLAFTGLNHWLANHVADGQTTITPRFADLVSIPQDQLWGIWPSGVDPEPFAEAAASRRWPGPGEPIRLVYIGMLLEKRHPLQLCRALLAALERGWLFELFYYGDGPEADQIRDCSKAGGGSIKVLPPISHEEVPSMLAKMHVGVTSLPDAADIKYAASSPIKLFEYMASGLPLLATTNPCHLDVVGGGSFAFWVDEPDEASILHSLEQIWTQRDTLARRGRAAQKMVDSWTWQSAASKLDEALRNGLEQRQGNTL